MKIIDYIIKQIVIEFKVAKQTEKLIFFPTKYNFSCYNIGY